ncbi:hypothetical protein MMC22_004730 [Lobaria immixta]|nr:hypothetical protein [Lobaria immixta]
MAEGFSLGNWEPIQDGSRTDVTSDALVVRIEEAELKSSMSLNSTGSMEDLVLIAICEHGDALVIINREMSWCLIAISAVRHSAAQQETSFILSRDFVLLLRSWHTRDFYANDTSILAGDPFTSKSHMKSSSLYATDL